MGYHECRNEVMATTATKSNLPLRTLAAIWLASTVVVFLRYREEVLGYSFYSSGAVEHVAAGATPTAIALALVGLLFLSVAARGEIRVDKFEIAPLWRRYVSVLVDFLSFVFVWGALGAMIPLALEARRTGKFQWSFTRDYSVPSDSVGGLLILVGLVTMVAYFVLPLASRRQTLGRWMLRIATVNVDGSLVRAPFLVALRRTYREVRELASFSTFREMVRGTPRNEGTYDDDRLIVVHY